MDAPHDQGMDKGGSSGPSGPAGPAGTDVDFSTLLTVADSLPVMIGYVDADYRFRFVNRPLADWFEISRKALLGQRPEDVMPGPSWAQRAPLFAAAMQGETQYYTAEFGHPTRGTRTTEAEYIPQRGSSGEVTGLVLVIQDVTERRATERRLSESEERFRRIADSAPVPIWVASADGSREFINKAYADFFHAEKDVAAGIEWTDRVHPDDEEDMHDALVEGLKSQAPFEFVARAKRHDGAYRWMHAQIQPRRDGDGRIVGYIGTATDVTHAKESERSLRAEVAEQGRELEEREKRFRAVFDSSMELIFLLEPDGRFTSVNRATLDMFELPLEALKGKKAWNAPPLDTNPESAATVQWLIQEAARGRVAQDEILIEHAGKRIALLASVKPVLGEDGTPIYLVGEARDISDLKVAQDQLRQAQKMEALGQLTGGIAHDFNNLLTVVVGGLDLIARRVEDEKLKRYADNALSAAERGARLTGQLLTFSRVQKLEVRPVTVGHILDDLETLLGNAMGPDVDLDWHIEDRDLAILADPTQLEVAMLNLALNARDAMSEDGKLSISAREVQLDEDPELQPGSYGELAIGDTGTGMDEETLERAFEPFFTTKDVGKGTGLGLSMVYGMARQSGGTVRIESAPGAGTTVRLFFRTAETPVQAPEESDETQARMPVEGLDILVVDDDEDVRGFVEASLLDRGAKVRVAADGAAGLAAFAEAAPDVLVLDYLMPGMSGAEVARVVREESPGQPLLFISGYSETDAIRKAAPDAPILTKPFSIDALEEVLCKLFDCAPERD